MDLDTTALLPSREGIGTEEGKLAWESQGLSRGWVGGCACHKELKDELMAPLCFCGPHLEAITDVIQWEFCKTQLEPAKEPGEVGGLPEERGGGA